MSTPSAASSSIANSSSSSSSSSSGKLVLRREGIVTSPLLQPILKKYDVEGLCCAYSMDWLASRLYSRVFLGNKDAVNWFQRLGRKQVKQHWAPLESDEPFKAVADSCNLVLGHDFDWRSGTKELKFKKMPYYLSLIYQHATNPDGYLDQGHGFAMDCRDTPWLADWGPGVYEGVGMTAEQVFLKHIQLLEGELATTIGYKVAVARAYYVGQRAVKPQVPPTD